MKKRITSVFAVLLLLSMLASCGVETSATVTEGGVTTAEMTDTETTPAETETETETESETEAPVKPPLTVKIISFNVQTENGTSVPFTTRTRIMKELMEEYMPDSIGMQEVTTNWRRNMDETVFGENYQGVGDARTPGGEANPIYFRKDKFELIDSGTFWLSDTPDQVGSYLEGVNYPRICTWVHLKSLDGGEEFVHLNTHLDHDGDNSASDARKLRLKQITVIYDFIQRFGDIPMVFTGDFNQRAATSEGKYYAVYKALTGQRVVELKDGTEFVADFADSRLYAPDNMPEGITSTMTKYYEEGTKAYNPARLPIDYVFFTRSSLSALSYKTVLYKKSGVYMSDHLPVIVELEFTPTATDPAETETAE